MPTSAGRSVTTPTSPLASATRTTSHLPRRCSVFELAALAQPDLVVGRYCGTPESGVDLEDSVRDGAELLRSGEMLRIRIRVRAGRRWQVFAPIAPSEIVQSCRGARQMLAGSRSD